MTGAEKTGNTLPGDTEDPARVVAVTGARGMLGSALVRRLETDRRYGRVIALDLREPSVMQEKTRFYKVDLTLPGADAKIADVLREEQVDTFVHLAFLSNFTHRSSWAHELESIGTMHVLNACSESRISKFVLWGQSLCYGAHPQNPAYLTEAHPQRSASGPNDTFSATK